ncbi:MAG TPA: hypothetical protein PK082_08405 [Phycisphaerae bacterium]|nr:hypothetical protein [Phycisphaerae bacterium]
MIRISDRFPRYEQFDPKVPVWCITPNAGRCIHRFFDTPPFSPSGRYAAVLRLPFEDRLPAPGDTAQVVLIDLQEGGEKVVAETRGWETQMGANLNWGPDDHTLLFNDVDTQTWTGHVVKLDPLTGKAARLDGGIYQASPDGKWISSSSMERMRRTQYGYGIVLPDEHTPRNLGAPDDDGLFITNVETGERKLVFSLADAVKLIPELVEADLEQWEIYGFHSKWNPQGDRLIFTVRRFLKRHPERFDLLSHGALRFDVFTIRPDGSDPHNAVPSICWIRGGHHINFFPDGKNLSMNLGAFAEGLRFYRVGYDGAGLRPMHYDVPGSGHPTIHPDGRHILTDSYVGEKVAFGDGTVPLRWVDRESWREQTAVRIGVVTEPKPVSALRVDPHPAWDRSWRWVAFNGVMGDNTRRVFVADFAPLLG